jgi:hypothetical protein
MRNKPGRSAYPRHWSKVLLLASINLCFSPFVWAQKSDSPDSDSNTSWTSTTDSKTDYANPTRTSESHTQNGNRTVDVQSLQTRGPDGDFRPYQDIETETVRVNATTVQTTTRTFVRDSGGMKRLFQITEEENRSLPGGDSKIERTTSNPDANGNLQVVQREIQETQKTSPDVQETRTTVILASGDGGLAPAMKMQERQKRNGNTIEITKTTLLPDGAGSWQVGEVQQSTIDVEGKNRSVEKRVSRPDSEGKFEEITRTVRKESEGAPGEKRNSEETYSIDVPGAGRDSSLHLVRRITTSQRSNSESQQSTELVEQPNPGDPGAGLHVSTVNIDTLHSGSSGTQSTRTIQVNDANGSLDVISVDMTRSDNVKAIEVQIAPSKPK